MTTLNKILIAIGSIILVALLGVIIYMQYEMKAQQSQLQNQIIQQQQQLADGITKSSSQFVTKGDLDAFIKQNGIDLKTIQASVDKLNGSIVAANNVKSNSSAQNSTNLPSSNTGPNNPTPPSDKTTDPFGYESTQQNLALNEDFSNIKVPLGSVGFSAWQKDPWSLKIVAREYNLNTVIATDENQQMSVYNKFSITVDGKEYNVPITTAKTIQQLPTPVWSWWNPRLELGVGGGVMVAPVKGEFTPSIGVSIMSYGQFKNQPDLAVLGVGVGYGLVTNRPQLVITPITFNLGKVIPLVHNTYFGPSAVIGTDGNVGAELGIQVGL